MSIDILCIEFSAKCLTSIIDNACSCIVDATFVIGDSQYATALKALIQNAGSVLIACAFSVEKK